MLLKQWQQKNTVFCCCLHHCIGCRIGLINYPRTPSSFFSSIALAVNLVFNSQNSFAHQEAVACTARKKEPGGNLHCLCSNSFTRTKAKQGPAALHVILTEKNLPEPSEIHPDSLISSTGSVYWVPHTLENLQGLCKLKT